MAGEIERIARMLEKTFERQPWYGPSVMDSLNKVNPEASSERVGHAHTMIELVMHMTAWRKFTAKRLRGDNTYEVSEEMNFPKAVPWLQAVGDLKTSQQELLAAVREFPEDRLAELVPSKVHKYTYYTLLHGIIQHDIYHLGQIAILQKALA